MKLWELPHRVFTLFVETTKYWYFCGNHQYWYFLWKPPILVFFVETTNIGEISEKPITVIGNHSNLLSNARLGRDFILWTPLAVANKLFAPTWWTSKLN